MRIALRKIEPKKETYNKQAAEYLAELLEQAKAGDIVEIFVVCKERDGLYTNCFTGCEDLIGMVWYLERMKQLTLRRMDA